jgi:hypothetical protein
MSQSTMTCDCCGGTLPMQQVWEARRHSAGDCTGGVDEDGRCFAFSDSDWGLHRNIINAKTGQVRLSNATARRYFLHANDVHEDGSLCCFFSDGNWGFWVRTDGTVDTDTASSNGELPSRKIVDACARAAVKFLQS